jgi:hypothetical protein
MEWKSEVSECDLLLLWLFLFGRNIMTAMRKAREEEEIGHDRLA